MDELILRHLSGETTDVERHRLEKWRESSPTNESRFQELRALWDRLEEASPSSPPSPLPDAGALMAEAERRRARSRAKRSRMAVLRSPWTGYGIAAVVIMIALFGVRTWRTLEHEGTALATVASSVEPGRVMAMTLSDGSILRLAEGSRVDFPASMGQREVTLEGKAFFAVAAGTVPFVVRTAMGELTVRGTRFEVTVDGQELRVVVVEGTVEMAGPGGAVEVGRGQVGTVRAGDAPRVVTVDDVWDLLDWPGGLLTFQSTPLRDVAGQIARHFGVDVRIADSSVVARRVTGSFGDDSLDDVVDAVCAVTGIRCIRRGDVVFLGASRE